MLSSVLILCDSKLHQDLTILLNHTFIIVIIWRCCHYCYHNTNQSDSLNTVKQLFLVSLSSIPPTSPLSSHPNQLRLSSTGSHWLRMCCIGCCGLKRKKRAIYVQTWRGIEWWSCPLLYLYICMRQTGPGPATAGHITLMSTILTW